MFTSNVATYLQQLQQDQANYQYQLQEVQVYHERNILVVNTYHQQQLQEVNRYYQQKLQEVHAYYQQQLIQDQSQPQQILVNYQKQLQEIQVYHQDQVKEVQTNHQNKLQEVNTYYQQKLQEVHAYYQQQLTQPQQQEVHQLEVQQLEVQQLEVQQLEVQQLEVQQKQIQQQQIQQEIDNPKQIDDVEKIKQVKEILNNIANAKKHPYIYIRYYPAIEKNLNAYDTVLKDTPYLIKQAEHSKQDVKSYSAARWIKKHRLYIKINHINYSLDRDIGQYLLSFDDKTYLCRDGKDYRIVEQHFEYQNLDGVKQTCLTKEFKMLNNPVYKENTNDLENNKSALKLFSFLSQPQSRFSKAKIVNPSKTINKP